MTTPRNVNRCTPCLEGEHARCTGSAGNIGCGYIHDAPVPRHAVREGRCPDGGCCHGSTFAAGSEPCPEGTCYRVRSAGPLSGVYPGDRWPAEVRAANGVEPARPPHALRVGRRRLGAQAWGNLRGAAGVRYGTDARCSCGWTWFTNADPPSRGGRLQATEAYADHLERALAEAEERGRQRGVAPFRDLFAGGPDTPCRTTYRAEGGYGGRDTVRKECVEVPLDEVRAAFAEAGERS